MYSLNDQKQINALSLSEIRHNMRQMLHSDEEVCVENLLDATQLTRGERS